MLPTTSIGTSDAVPGSEPQLTDRTPNPRGVVQKNMKVLLYLGAVLVLVLATLISSFKKKPAVAAKNADAPAPVLQDNTANNAAAFHSQLDSEHLRRTQEGENGVAPIGTQAQSGAATGYSPTGLPVVPVGCVPSQPCSPGGMYSASQASSSGQAQLAAKEKERLYTSRFASNLAFTGGQSQEPAQAPPSSYAPSLQPGQPTNLTAGRNAGEQAAASQSYKRSAEVNVDAAIGQPYVIYEGLTLDTVLMNRLDGDAAGSRSVLLCSHGHLRSVTGRARHLADRAGREDVHDRLPDHRERHRCLQPR